MKDNKKNNRTTVVISPHSDDAIISIGNYVISNFERVVVVNVFNLSCGTILPIPDGEVTKVGMEEDGLIAKKYGVEFMNCDFKDTSLRKGVDWDDYQAPIDFKLLKEIARSIYKKISAVDNCDSIFIPAAYGLHPDHYLSLLAFTEQEVAGLLKKMRFYIYCDQQYYYEGLHFHKGHQYLQKYGTFYTKPFDLTDKRQMISVYRSQLSQERVNLLAGTIRSEYFWSVDLGFFSQSKNR